MAAIPRYRIGNDLTIFWAINNRDGSPFDLSGKEVHLFVNNSKASKEVEIELSKLPDGRINNVIRWDFKGSQQKILGDYSLTVKVLESETHREITKDYSEAFTLVSRSENELEGGDANISIGGDLILSSKLDIYRIEATNVDVSALKTKIYEVEQGLGLKVSQEEFDTKTGEIEKSYAKVEVSLEGVTTEIKDIRGETTQIKNTVDGITVSVGDLEHSVDSLERQSDGAIDRWFYAGVPGPDVLPESEWLTDEEKFSHLGDLYYDENTGLAYRYSIKEGVFYWKNIEDTDITAALEAAKNNNKTFIDQPRPPYKVGDLWIAEKAYPDAGIDADDILVCENTRESGLFDISDWRKRGNAINDEDLEDFIDDYYQNIILPEISKQTDKQSSAYYGDTDPSLEWEEGSAAEHVGDLWYNTSTNRAYYWSGTEWVESEIPEEVFDKIDGKSTIYAVKPEGEPYKENDLWFLEKDYNEEGFQYHKGTVLMALEDAVYNEELDTYIFHYTDWVKRDSYTDDTAVTNLNEYILTGFKDGVLTESEKQSISSAWDSIVLAQDQLTQDYLTVILPGYVLPEFEDLQNAYKTLYNEEPTDEFPNIGAFQILEEKVKDILAYEPTYEPTIDKEAIAALIEAYDNAHDDYRRALSDYSTAYGIFTNAIRAELGQANEYIEAIIDDGKLTPIEKKQLLEVYRSLVAEFATNKDSAYTAKVWKLNDDGEEVPGVYAGPNAEGQEYFDTYVAYKEAFNPIKEVFSGTDWGFDKMDETTVFEGDINLSLLSEYFDAYYVALEAISHVLSTIAEEKNEAIKSVIDYVNDIEEVLTPMESFTQIGKGVVLSSVIGVGVYDQETGEFHLKAGLNAVEKDAEGIVTTDPEHGRVVIVGGADADKNWNNANFVLYEDGHVKQLSGEIGKEVKIGEAVIRAVLANEINLLSYPVLDEETGETTMVPLFSVNTKTDENGKKRIVSISTLYDLDVAGNIVARGEVAAGGVGEEGPSSGEGIDEDQLEDYLKEHEYVTKDEVADLIPDVDLSDYATTTEVEEVKTQVRNLDTELRGEIDDVVDNVELALDKKASKEEVEIALTDKASKDDVKAVDEKLDKAVTDLEKADKDNADNIEDLAGKLNDMFYLKDGTIGTKYNFYSKGEISAGGVGTESEGGGGEGSTTLDGLMDVEITGVDDFPNTDEGRYQKQSQVLGYNSQTGIWVNKVTMYRHAQSKAESEWNITHNLGKMPNVKVIDSTGALVHGTVVYDPTDLLNKLTISFGGAFSGTAYLD